PLKFFATIIPFLSIRNVWGIEVNLNSDKIGSFHPIKFDNCSQCNLSFSIALTQRSLLSSKETPMIFKPLSLYLSYIFTTCGFSFRQGPHHDAQKSINVYLPKFSYNDCWLLFTSGILKSDTLAPIITFLNSSRNVFNLKAFSVFLVISSKLLYKALSLLYWFSLKLFFSFSMIKILMYSSFLLLIM